MMRVSKLFGESLRDSPSDVDIISHQLLVRAGYVRQLAAGIFSYLPLAQRSLSKIKQILREEMGAIGAQELSMPIVHPAEPWQQTGRWEAIDETMVRFKDRREREMLLAMTHEEVVAALARSEIRSYRQLPQLVYQLQTKFRDEARPRGGLIRTREFLMKDSYSLDRDEAGLRKQYIIHYNAYFRIAARVALPVIAVRSDTGMMGGQMAHEFMYLTPIGEDTLVRCSNCGYAANQEVAQFVKAPLDTGPPRPLQKVHTPGVETIEALATYLGIEPHQTVKSVFFTGDYGPGKPGKLIIGVVRGDMEVNQTQIQNLSGAKAIRPALPEEMEQAGALAGYASPIGLRKDNVLVIVDDLVQESTSLVAGANEQGYHLLNTCCGRDYEPDIISPIVLAYEGAPCIVCHSPLSLVRGVEVGNIFQLGTRYSAALNALYVDEQGAQQPIVMGSYGIGIGRLLACIAEEHRDEQGLALPISVAPYQVALVSLPRSKETQELAEKLYQGLVEAGIEVLYDDREVSPGIKFADADLRGLPLRLTISDRSLKHGGIELKRRTSKDASLVPLHNAVAATRAEIKALTDELAAGWSSIPVWEEQEAGSAG